MKQCIICKTNIWSRSTYCKPCFRANHHLTPEQRLKISLAKKGKCIPPFTQEHKDKLAISKFGSLNPMWKGDNVGYFALHRWVIKRLLKPPFCQMCHNRPPTELSNNGIYNRDLSNWEWLCKSCHSKKDDKIVGLQHLK